MAKPRTTEPGYTNPEVTYERSDIDTRSVVRFGVGFAALIVVSAVLMWAVFKFVERREAARKKSDLPPAAVDQSQGLPPIPLEGIEDVAEGKPRLFPPRAAEDARPRERQLDDGDAAKGVLPIDEAMRRYAAQQAPAEPGKAPPPAAYTIRLPSKAAAGRVETGGQ